MKKANLILILTLFVNSVSSNAQDARIQSLMQEARTFSQQKEYDKSNKTYEQLISLLDDSEYSSLIPTVKEMIALNYMYLAAPFLKGDDFEPANKYLEQALEYTVEGTKVDIQAHSLMGHLHSRWAQIILTSHGGYDTAMMHAVEAEKQFEQAKMKDKTLWAMLIHVDVLKEMSKIDDAESMLNNIIDECGENTDYAGFKGKALQKMGTLDIKRERYDQAIRHLEMAYKLCKENDEDIYAKIVARNLVAIYENHIPDAEKAELWRQRTE